MESIIVTGASSGIGRAACTLLAKSGYLVFGLARSYDRLHALASELPAGRYVPVEFDATKPETFAAVTGSIRKRARYLHSSTCRLCRARRDRRRFDGKHPRPV